MWSVTQQLRRVISFWAIPRVLKGITILCIHYAILQHFSYLLSERFNSTYILNKPIEPVVVPSCARVCFKTVEDVFRILSPPPPFIGMTYFIRKQKMKRADDFELRLPLCLAPKCTCHRSQPNRPYVTFLHSLFPQSGTAELEHRP